MKPSEGNDASEGARADGGDAPPIDSDVFTRTADEVSISWDERARQFFDRNVYAPAAVLFSDWRASVGALILLGFVLMATVGVILIPQPSPMQGPIFLMPFQNWNYPLGTGVMGKDLFAMVVHAAPAMWKMIIAGSFVSVALGTTIGTVAGYKGGAIDQALMGLTDVVITIPGLVLIVVLAAIYEPRDPFVVGILLGIDNWPGLARTLRSQVLSIREESFTEASRVMGLSQLTIFRKDIISNMMPYISVNLAGSARGIIFESVGLYFLGILPFTSLNWGVMMNEAYNGANLTNPSQIHWLLVPMTAIIFISLGFILLAQGLDRVFNVRLRARHANTTSDEE